MREVLHDSKTVREEPLRPIFAEKKNSMDGEVGSGGLDPGRIRAERVSVKDTRSNRAVQRTPVFGVE